jgi:hypothetical protein
MLPFFFTELYFVLLYCISYIHFAISTIFRLTKKVTYFNHLFMLSQVSFLLVFIFLLQFIIHFHFHFQRNLHAFCIRYDMMIQSSHFTFYFSRLFNLCHFQARD